MAEASVAWRGGFCLLASNPKKASKRQQGGCNLPNFVNIEKGLGPEGRIAVVRFDRGDGINALSPDAIRQLTAAANSFEDDGDTSAVVLTGSAKAFSAGFDLKTLKGAKPWILGVCGAT